MAFKSTTTNPSDGEDSFLGGKKFNQAGFNSPMPGEKVSEATNSPGMFGGPKVWIGAIVIIALVAVLWMVYGGNIPGIQHVGGHGGISSSDRPVVDPDAKPDSTQ